MVDYEVYYVHIDYVLTILTKYESNVLQYQRLSYSLSKYGNTDNKLNCEMVKLLSDHQLKLGEM